MKKLFTFVSALAFSVFAFASTTVSMDFSDPAAFGYAKPDAGKYTQVADNGTIAKENVVLTVNFTTGSGFRFFANTNSGVVNLRGYANAKLTITPPTGKKLLKISANGSNLNTSYMSGDMTGQKWEGEADKVEINITQSTVQINSLTVEYGNAGETPVVTKVDTIGVSQAIARINAGNKGECYVKGVVAGDPFSLGTNGPAFYLTDIANSTDSLEGFKIGKDANTQYKDEAEMAADFLMGDTILIYASGLDKYKNIFETTGGYFCKVLGKSNAILLDWNEATATLGEGSWNILIEKDSKNFIDLNFASSKKDGIAGSHAITEGTITYNGAEAAIVGSIKFTFKELSENSLNIYNVQAVLNAGEKLYRLTKDIEVYAQDADEEGIDLEGDRPFVPTEDGQEATCAQAREYALSLASGSESELSLTVEGYVTDLFNTGVTFWMDDQKGTTKTLQVYSFKNLVAEEGIELQNGAHVKVVGKVKNYNGTPEVINATVEILDGGKEIVPVKASVAEALAAAKALAQGKTSTETYEIHGFIASIEEEFSADHGNISFKMSDKLNDTEAEFVAFRVECDAILAEDLLVGARVQVTAKVQHFHQNATTGDDPKPERTVYETVKGGKVELIFHTATETIKVDVQAIKFIENGQVIILRDGVRYNVQGQLAK